MIMEELTDAMRAALEFYGRLYTDGETPAVAWPTTGTTVALITRKLLTPAPTKWDHKPTDAGWDWLAEHTSYTPVVAHWHVGSHLHSYEPDSAPFCTASRFDARTALASIVGDLVDSLADGCEHPKAVKGCENCTHYAAAWSVHHLLTNVEGASDKEAVGDGARFELYDGRTLPLVYWAQLVTMDHRECNAE
jgi:hypothetical protein